MNLSGKIPVVVRSAVKLPQLGIEETVEKSKMQNVSLTLTKTKSVEGSTPRSQPSATYNEQDKNLDVSDLMADGKNVFSLLKYCYDIRNRFFH